MINFCAYLENKILFFENDTDYFYDFETKMFYPIINNSIYINYGKNKIEIEKKGLLPKIKNSIDYLIKSDNIKNNTFNVLIKNSNNNELTDQKEAQYIEVNGIFFPLIKSGQEISYVDGSGKEIKISDEELKTYKKTKNKFYNYYINLKSSKGGSSSSVASELNELETAEETPAEPTEEETK